MIAIKREKLVPVVWNTLEARHKLVPTPLLVIMVRLVYRQPLVIVGEVGQLTNRVAIHIGQIEVFV